MKIQLSIFRHARLRSGPTATLALIFLATAQGQSRVITIKIANGEIGTVKTARGMTTMLSFQQRPTEIICGDLYDPESGTGSFVVQRSGNDVYLKPVASDGMSNLFVKAGENGKDLYSFDLLIVPQAEAFRIVKVVSSHDDSIHPGAAPAATLTPNSAAGQRSARDIPWRLLARMMIVR
jgi:hypothetical protein